MNARALPIAVIALLCSPGPAGATRHNHAEVPMDLFPTGRSVRLNAIFWVPVTSRAELPLHYKSQRARLLNASGAIIPTRTRRMPSGPRRSTMQLRPVADLKPLREYCVQLYTMSRGAEILNGERCLQTGTTRDDTPPTGGTVHAVALQNGGLRVDVEAGFESSAVALEVEASPRPGSRTCRTIASRGWAQLKWGLPIEFDRRSDAAACFRDLPTPNPELVVRTRWLDAAGNVGAWSGRFLLPEGSPSGFALLPLDPVGASTPP